MSFLLQANLASAANLQMAIQGALRSATGAAVADGNYPMAFRLYENAIGGDALFEDFSLGIAVSNGIFSYTLGANAKAPLDLAAFSAAKAHFIGIQVATDPELARVALLAVPYAARSEWSASAAALACSGCVGAGEIAVAAIKAENLADGAVTSGKIGAGAVLAAHAGFNYATSDAKGGDALLAKVAKDLSCSGCVVTADLADASVTKAKLAATIVADLGLIAGDKFSDVALSGKYSDLIGKPDLTPYALLANANLWPKKQSMGADTDFGLHQALQFRYQTADAPPAVCDANTVGLIYLDTKTQDLRVCFGGKWKVVSSLNDPLGTQANPAQTCKELLAAVPQTVDGIYYLKPAGAQNAFKAYCLMSVAGGGWTLAARVSINDGQNLLYDAWSAATYGTIGDLTLTGLTDALYDTYATVPGNEMLAYDGTQACGNDNRLLQTPSVLGNQSLQKYLTTLGKAVEAAVNAPNWYVPVFRNAGCQQPFNPQSPGQFPGGQCAFNIVSSYNGCGAYHARFACWVIDYDAGIGGNAVADGSCSVGEIDVKGDGVNGWTGHAVSLLVR